MAQAQIQPIPMGFTTSYLILPGMVLVDAGPPDKAQHLEDTLERLSLRPKDIQLIVITHGHWDHIGSACEIREMTEAPIAMHEREKDRLEKAVTVMPPGVTRWGKFLAALAGPISRRVKLRKCRVDAVLRENVFSLRAFGVMGDVFYTPGHSPGSVSVLLESGEAFVGDLAMNRFPLRLRAGLPIFAEVPEKIKESWELLLARGAKTIYPGHGKPFSANALRKRLR